jgi:XRE family transcriptional regulator, regulator of sulfur utilization
LARHERNKAQRQAIGRSSRQPSRSLEQSLGAAIRRLREQRRLSVRTLARKCGFSPSFISQVELNQASPSLTSLEQIARGLGVTVGQFFEAATSTGPIVVRSSERPVLQSEWSRSQIESLGHPGLDSRLEALLITIRPSGRSGGHMHSRETELFAIVFAGEVRLHVGETTQLLRRGDAVTIPPGTPHRWENNATKAVQLLKVIARVAP